jgi:hypothetical protein
MSPANANIQFGDLARRLLWFLVAIGLGTLVAGLFLNPDRIFGNLLLVSFGIVGLGLGGGLFLATQYLTGAGWATALRRIPEAMVTLLPLGAIGILIVVFLRPGLYPWTDPSPALQHLMVGFKGAWLDRPFFLGRAVFYLVVWTLLARALVVNSRRQDADGDLMHSVRNGRVAAVFAVVCVVSFCAACFDWIMSLEPEWFSTIFGMYNLAGLFVATLSVITIYSIWLRRRGEFRDVLSGEHLHDLGKLLMGFSTFWAYMWFSQYMLIWYSNMPEETGYYVLRRSGTWNSLFLLNLIVNWALPFFTLLPVQSKRSAGVMAKVAVLLLAGRWLDLYLMVMPPVLGFGGPRVGIWEIGLLLGTIGAVALLVTRQLSAAPLLPVRDPRYQQSLQYHS